MTRPDPDTPVPTTVPDAAPADTEAPGRAGDPADTSPADEPFRKALADVEQMKDAWLRARAETENVRRQAQADVAKAYKFAIEKFAGDLLPVKDALEQALSAAAGATASATPETLRAGTELTLKALNAAFAKAGIAEIDPAGQRFDPHQHQAMQVVDSALPPNSVVTVYQKGYLINDRVLRPALVTVARSDGRGSEGGAPPSGER
ncbi:MAG TPA: nucleotide exchange factor GrpE [Casimicrobiaceae bacterium]